MMIAYGMLYTVAVGVPVLAAAWALAGVLRHYGRPERAVWLGALVLSLAVPTLTFLSRSMPAEGGATGAVAADAATGVIGLPAVVAVPEAAGDGALLTLLIALWVTTSLVLAVRLGVAAVRLARASRAWRPGTMDGAPVWFTESMGPAVAGLLKPRVLVPGWLAGMSPDRRSLALLHEQEHIRAGDPWLVLASRVAPILTPWNPVVWLLSARLLRAIELDCDRRVLRHRPDVRTYGSTLIEISARDRARLVAVAAFAESEAPLRSRILHMTTPSRTVSVVALLTSMVLGVVLMVAAFEIPVPTIRADLQIGPPSADAPVAGTDESDAGDADAALADGTPASAGAAAEAGEPSGGEPGDTQGREETREEAPGQQPDRVGPPSGAEWESGLEPTGPVGADGLAARPTFTPFTQPPRLLDLRAVQQALAAAYPPALRDSGIEGTVTLWFFIDAEGRVAQTRVDRSSGHEALDEAALRVASVYRFSPALNRDERVPVWVSLPISFRVR